MKRNENFCFRLKILGRLWLKKSEKRTACSNSIVSGVFLGHSQDLLHTVLPTSCHLFCCFKLTKLKLLFIGMHWIGILFPHRQSAIIIPELPTIWFNGCLLPGLKTWVWPPGTSIAGGNNWLLQAVLWPQCLCQGMWVCGHVHAHTHIHAITHTHRVNKCKEISKM